MSKKLFFLFGAGISKAAGFPLSQDITDTVLTNNIFFKNTDGTYKFYPKPLCSR
jgi:NAD-dependent SIR2 family protein deacetylase